MPNQPANVSGYAFGSSTVKVLEGQSVIRRGPAWPAAALHRLFRGVSSKDPFWNGSRAGGTRLAAAISDTFLGTAKSCFLPVARDAQIT